MKASNKKGAHPPGKSSEQLKTLYTPMFTSSSTTLLSVTHTCLSLFAGGLSVTLAFLFSNIRVLECSQVRAGEKHSSWGQGQEHGAKIVCNRVIQIYKSHAQHSQLTAAGSRWVHGGEKQREVKNWNGKMPLWRYVRLRIVHWVQVRII
jgi:hypothetical protein